MFKFPVVIKVIISLFEAGSRFVLHVGIGPCVFYDLQVTFSFPPSFSIPSSPPLLSAVYLLKIKPFLSPFGAVPRPSGLPSLPLRHPAAHSSCTHRYSRHHTSPLPQRTPKWKPGHVHMGERIGVHSAGACHRLSVSQGAQAPSLTSFGLLSPTGGPRLCASWARSVWG